MSMIIGGIYTVNERDNNNIFMWDGYDSFYFLGTGFNGEGSNARFVHGHGGFNGTNPYRDATPEEKHWLKECIRLHKWMTREVAMLTFKSEIEFYKIF